MTEAQLEPIKARSMIPDMIGRPIDHRGFPVPWFVTNKTPEGHWDFARLDTERFKEAVRKDVCWVSGHPLGQFRSFVIGPMCVINRVAGDPPVKKAIAEWSAQICPYLSRPLARRDRSIADEEYELQRGVMITRNPGVCAVYTVRGPVPVNHGLFMLPEPKAVEWWRQGRRATRAEVVAAVESGLPLLREAAEKESRATGSKAPLVELEAYLIRAETLYPQE